MTMTAEVSPGLGALDGRRFRDVLGHVPTGVVVVTAMDPDGTPVGMTIGSFTSVSLDPPLVAFLPRHRSQTFAQLRTAERFCINVLAGDQEGVCRRFARPGEDRFDGLAWTPSPGGAPIISDAVAWIECGWHDVLPAGDHDFAIGRVRALGVLRPVQPLLFFQGGYGRFVPMSLLTLPTPDLIEGVRLAEAARPEVERLAEELGVECSLLAAAGGDLVIVGAVAARDLTVSSSVGSRVPLRAPLGDLYVAWQPDDVVDRWVAGAGPDPEAQDRFRRRLARVRERGWSMSLVAPRPEAELHEAVRAYCAPDLTPSRQRALEEEIRQFADAYEPVDLDGAEHLDVHSLVVPIRGDEGEVALVLRLGRLPRGLSGDRVQELVDRMSAAAARISAATCR